MSGPRFPHCSEAGLQLFEAVLGVPVRIEDVIEASAVEALLAEQSAAEGELLGIAYLQGGAARDAELRGYARGRRASDSDAEADLASAAPEMLAALEDIVGMIAGCADAPKNPDSLPQMVLYHARAAIAKVKGRV